MTESSDVTETCEYCEYYEPFFSEVHKKSMDYGECWEDEKASKSISDKGYTCHKFKLDGFYK